MIKSIKIYTIILTALHMVLLAVVLAGCSDEYFPAEEQQSTQPAGESREVRIAVNETDWDGHTVKVTRAGETLEALKDNSNRIWDFTKTPRTDINLLKSDAAKAEGARWEYNEPNNRYTNSSTIDGALVANGVELYMTEDLSFSSETSNIGKIKIDVDKQLQLGGSNIVLTISNLKAGQEVTIKFAATGETAATFDTRTNLKDATGFTAANKNTTQEGTATVVADGTVSFKNTTNDTGINIYSISVTRAESDGFGLYCSSDRMKVINSHIVWDSEIQSWKGISNDAYLMLWPYNIMRCNVAFNGSDVQSWANYYSFTGYHNFNSKFTGCTYDGITFTQGLKMESSTCISFTPGISSNPVTVTIVQSDWQDAEHPHGTPKTIQFDYTTLDVANAKTIPGGRVYTIRNVVADASTTHTITRGSGESGIFYICADIPFTAYSPYISDANLVPAEKVNLYPAENNDAYGFVSRNKDNIVFKPHSDNRIDLMYAEHTTTNDGVVNLNFKHALGKLSIGTIRNDYGENLRLTQIRITGTRYTKGTLSLSTGEWSSQTSSSEVVTYGESLLRSIFGSLNIPNKGSLTFPKDIAYTQIPGTTLTFEYQFTTGSGTTFTVSATMRFDQGVNKFVNITINQNHEVVLE